MNKRFGFIILLVMVLGISSIIAFKPEAKQQFTDVSERYMEAVDHIVTEGYARGISETQYATSRPIIRIDAAVMIANVLGYKESGTYPASGFTDVPANRAWATDALKAAGVINGKTATSYGAYSTMTRSEMAKMITAAYELEATSQNIPFTDVNSRFAPDVAALVEAGVTSGKTPTRFGANDPITRGEFALFIFRADQIGMDLTPPEVISVD